ncbi:hypothetical protein [Myxococcus sp. AB025B]|uniref:hypothetical protein n=1 Tax=Myxococcus sp. AB025B TaxID=2562794 RepID=UPI001890C296|nr:hypothetical protein [Myxococcus sp. AB025B]
MSTEQDKELGSPPSTDSTADETKPSREDLARTLLSMAAEWMRKANDSGESPPEAIPLFDGLEKAAGVSIPGKLLWMRRTLSLETDRGCALVAAAHLDQALGKLLRAFFVDDPSTADEFLGNNRPLGTFSSRIQACLLLGLLRKDQCRDLDLIRKVRNEFAHLSERLSFESPKIRDRCKSFGTKLSSIHIEPRHRFMGVVMRLSTAIHFSTEEIERRKEPAPPPLVREEDVELIEEAIRLLKEMPLETRQPQSSKTEPEEEKKP